MNRSFHRYFFIFGSTLLTILLALGSGPACTPEEESHPHPYTDPKDMMRNLERCDLDYEFTGPTYADTAPFCMQVDLHFDFFSQQYRDCYLQERETAATPGEAVEACVEAIGLSNSR